MSALQFDTAFASMRFGISEALQSGAYNFGALLFFGVVAAVTVRVLLGVVVNLLDKGAKHFGD